MAAVSFAVVVGFAVVMFGVPLVVAGWIAYDARKRGVFAPASVWVVVAVFTTAVGALVSLYVYVTRVRSAGRGQNESK